MGLSGQRTYVGFGFGAIQTGLFLYEAYQSGHFGRLVVAEVVPEVVAAVRAAGGQFSVNIAHLDRIESVTIGPIQIENPREPADRERLIEAIASAEEIGTAVPSVNYYSTPGQGSLHEVLAEGLRLKARRGGPRAVIYAAENHHRAAESLHEQVESAIPDSERATVNDWVRYLNTVIPKMSGLTEGSSGGDEASVLPVTPGSSRAFLVEAFNRILISKVDFSGTVDSSVFTRGIGVFQEKADLLPFEMAKLFGHNGTHALAAYLGTLCGVRYIAELQARGDILAVMRTALISEAGMALIRRYAGIDDLFTPDGFKAMADDLLERMLNPYLRDTVERVGRDPIRKLGWNDRLIGAMRLMIEQGVAPVRYGVGAAAALATLEPEWLRSDASPAQQLGAIWGTEAPAAEQAVVIEWVERGRKILQAWIEVNYQRLDQLVEAETTRC
jgi:mannitol-1-phosphate 5-dehydrogenase